MADLQGKQFVVLGGTSGFGFAAAKAALQAGAEVIVGSRNQDNIDKAVAELGGNARGGIADVSDEAGLTKFFQQLGSVDHVLVTAGDSLPAAINTTDEARRFFEVRFWGTYIAAKTAAPCVRPGGSITLTNGILALRPWKGWATVSAVAGAVESLTRGLALDMAPIRVNAVCAGIVRTALWGGMQDADREALYAQTAKQLPLGRIGETEDVAATYLYLMQSEFTTGQVVVIDGGAMIV